MSGKTETIGNVKNTYGYTYDKAGRLTGVKKNGVVVSSYSYDSNSNRVSATTTSGPVTATYDAQDRVLTYGKAAYTYTANGELAGQTVGTQTTSYSYDVLGNLTSVVLPDGTAITYVVDAENRRIGTAIDGVLQVGYLYDDDDRIVAQMDAANQIVSQFVYGTDSTSPDSLIQNGVSYRIVHDHQGSPRLVVNAATGAIVQRIDYDEFGTVINDTNPGFQPFGFSGGLYDQHTKLIRFGARDYDPNTGRWTAKDPLLFGGGDVNLYEFVFGDPVNSVDPTGTRGVTLTIGEAIRTDSPTFTLTIGEAIRTDIHEGRTTRAVDHAHMKKRKKRACACVKTNVKKIVDKNKGKCAGLD